jgi:transcriptional regulator with XRE-family HTH domain
MTLEDWRRQNRITMTQLAGMLGIGGSNPGRTVHRYITGERIPDRAMMREIERVTSSAVTDDDFPLQTIKRTSLPQDAA